MQGQWLASFPHLQHYWQALLQRLLLAGRIFWNERMTFRAGALTYVFILALVPVLALIFAIAKGFGLDNYIDSQIHAAFSSQPQVVDTLLTFANRYLLNAQQGVFVGVGILMLLYTIWSLMSGIETTFNQIWQIKEERSIFAQIKDYIFAAIFLAIFLIISSGLSIFLSKSLESVIGYIPFIKQVPLLWSVPYILMILFFTLLYSFMPNTSVRLRSAFIAGLPVGILIQCSVYGYFYLQMMMTSYNAVYGSLAALPLIMIWIRILWYIILYGTALSYADQHIGEYAYGRNRNWNNTSLDNLSISICIFVFQRFKQGNTAPKIAELQETFQVPTFILETSLDKLVSAQVLLINSSNQGYIPAADLSLLTVGKVLYALDKLGNTISFSHGSSKFENYRNNLFIGGFNDELIVNLSNDGK
ncbi:hypothetical protein HMPREF9332_00120 [Alloprevotella rava F0323]|uniref:YihY family protein n=1 Tax=Alloprevotella rava F0323 TaxID=679199 RepID=G5G969_9BACT|nr:hypothetical protein HMPREF9332_00120 [Alloprevotella rava F0323]